MHVEGPEIARLTHRLSECPEDFLAEPARGEGPGVRTEAVVHDLLCDLGWGVVAPNALDTFRGTASADRNRLRLVLVAAWLLHDESFRPVPDVARRAQLWLVRGINELAKLVAADLFVRDPDRREELARLCLAALSLDPAGESRAQAEDRLRTLNSVERARVIEATRAQEERARKLREKLREEQAREAAAKASREW